MPLWFGLPAGVSGNSVTVASQSGRVALCFRLVGLVSVCRVTGLLHGGWVVSMILPAEWDIRQ